MVIALYGHIDVILNSANFLSERITLKDPYTALFIPHNCSRSIEVFGSRNSILHIYG